MDRSRHPPESAHLGALSLRRSALIVGAPLALAVLEIFHPHPDDLLDVDVKTWLTIHYAQILLFPLSAWAVAALVHGHAGLASAICRAAMFVFAVAFVAFDTVAGVVTGVLVDAARTSRVPDTWRPAIDAVWTHPVIGGSPRLAAPVFALVGSIALSIGGVAAAMALRRNGASLGPVVLLAISSFGLSVFRTHAWPGGPLTFGGLAIAAGWLLRQRDTTRRGSG